MELEMRFAKTVFFVAGLWGLVVLTPLYFTADLVGRLYPPPMTHPDFYYGFIGVAVVWQIGFLVIGRDPARLHPMMIPAALEKFVYVTSLSVLYLKGRVAAGQFAVVVPDLVLGILFIVSFFKVEGARRRSGGA
jgi:hypothetical protein